VRYALAIGVSFSLFGGIAYIRGSRAYAQAIGSLRESTR
jgi:hypothetical protein